MLMNALFRVKSPKFKPRLRWIIQAALETYRGKNIRKVLVIAHHYRIHWHILAQVYNQGVVFDPCALR